MVDLKLAKLPERTPIKLSVSFPRDLHDALCDYAAAYAETYGHEEPLVELVPAMLRAFIESDRAFLKLRSRLTNALDRQG